MTEKRKKKNNYALFYGWVSTSSRLQSDYEETVYSEPTIL